LAKIQHFVFPVFDFGGASPCCLKIFRCLGFWRVWFSFCANFVLAAPDFFSTGFCVGHQISFCPVHLLAFPGFWRWFRSAQGAGFVRPSYLLAISCRRQFLVVQPLGLCSRFSGRFRRWIF
jgi:hypothetical protein